MITLFIFLFFRMRISSGCRQSGRGVGLSGTYSIQAAAWPFDLIPEVTYGLAFFGSRGICGHRRRRGAQEQGTREPRRVADTAPLRRVPPSDRMAYSVRP